MKTAHTPGPWKVYDHIFHNEAIKSEDGSTYESKTVWIEDPNGLVLGQAMCLTTGTFNQDLDSFEANARLMAAAPELLEALQKIVANPAHYVTCMREHWADSIMVLDEDGVKKAEEWQSILDLISKVTEPATVTP